VQIPVARFDTLDHIRRLARLCAERHETGVGGSDDGVTGGLGVTNNESRMHWHGDGRPADPAPRHAAGRNVTALSRTNR
jgi:hypothetical protein